MGEEIFKTTLWCTVLLAVISVTLGYEVLHAVNFGHNGQQTDSNGLVYQAPDDDGCAWWFVDETIYGTLAQNEPLYSHFCGDIKITSEIPILDMKDGSYLLVLRLIEMFDSGRITVQFNGHKHLEHFSFHNTDRNIHAFDEHIYFSICGEQVLYKSEQSAVQDNKLRLIVESIAGNLSMLSALVLVRGDVENFPKLASNPNSTESEWSKWAVTTHRCGNDNNCHKSIINHGTMNINININ
jgi:hypothetical protein